MEDSSQFSSSYHEEESFIRQSLSVSELHAHLMKKYLSISDKPYHSAAKSIVNKTIGGILKYLNANFRDTNVSDSYIFIEETEVGSERFLGPSALELIRNSESWGKLNSKTAKILKSIGVMTDGAYVGASIPTKGFSFLRDAVIELTGDKST